MSSRIPIVIDHDPERVVGYMEGSVVTFQPGTVTNRNMIPAGWRASVTEEVGGKVYILEAHIVEFSIDSQEEP